MSMLQMIYDEACNTSTWSAPEPENCGCRGGGWFLSDVDTWHKCPRHNDGQPNGEGTEEDWKEYEAKKAGTFQMPTVEMPTYEFAKAFDENDDIPF